MCVFRRRSDVQISDVYPIKIHIWKWLRSDAKKSDQIFLCQCKRRSRNLPAGSLLENQSLPWVVFLVAFTPAAGILRRSTATSLFVFHVTGVNIFT